MKLGALLILNTVLVCASPAMSQMQSLGPKDTFAASRLSAREIHEIVEEVEQSAYDTPDSWEKELRVKRVNLGASPGGSLFEVVSCFVAAREIVKRGFSAKPEANWSRCSQRTRCQSRRDSAWDLM